MGRWTGSSPRRARRGARRNELGAFAADWMLVIAAVLGLGGLSAYLVEENIESLTLEESANQRDTVAYLDGGHTLNTEHRDVRRALAAAEQIVDEAVSVGPDDARFATWADWTRHFDAKCRRLELGYSHMGGFAVTSLFLPPLKRLGSADYNEEPSKVGEQFNSPDTATELAAADTTPYFKDALPYSPGGQHDKASVVDLTVLSARKKVVTLKWVPPQFTGKSVTSVNQLVHRGPVAWCFLPRSVSATLPDGSWDNDNLRYRAAKAWADGVGRDAVADDPERPGNKDLPGTWRNWEDHWTARCRRAVQIFSDLKGFAVKADFTKPAAAGRDALIFDPLRGGSRAAREPYMLKDVDPTPNTSSAPRPVGTASCEIVPA